MKNRFQFMLFGIVFIIAGLVTACGGHGDGHMSVLAGTYVNHTVGEYAVADDTLMISHSSGEHFLIVRKTGYRSIRSGKRLPKRIKLERLEGDYDEVGFMLHETLTGRLYRFDAAHKLLLLKQAVYRKLN